MGDRTLAIVPAFNEQGNIRSVIEELKRVSPAIDIAVIDDGSQDHTAAVAREAGAIVISLPFNLGIGGAVQSGYQWAVAHDYDLAVQVDGDGQHDPAFLSQLCAPIREGRADVVIASRFLPPQLGYRSSFIRRAGIQFFSGLLSALTQTAITDPTSGFRACSARLARVFAEDYPVDFPEPEAIVVAHRAGAKIIEVPVKMRERLSGRSSIRYLKTLYYMIKVTLAILLRMIKP